MSYQTGVRRCRRCGKPTHHWRELPDIPRHWDDFLEVAPLLLWSCLVTHWNCRMCKGVPAGPLVIGPRVRRP